MWVDDRLNWFMFGVAASLNSHFHRPLSWVLLLIAVSIFLYWFLGKYKYFGEADLSSFGWVTYGLGIIDPFALVIFWTVLVILTGLLVGFKRLVVRREGPSPYYIFILGSFLITVVWKGILFDFAG